MILRILSASALTLAALTTGAEAAPKVGAPAPAFEATDSNGKTHKLADFKGKTVVLEWTNHSCPYVVKHYDGANMQAVQADASGQGVVWLSVISSAAGKQGNVDRATANKLTTDRNAKPTAVLLDPEGTLGKLYDARTTPHMFVIDASGVLRYQGAIDDKPSTAPASLQGATNYVRQALTDIKAGKPVAVSETEPYGCSVKY